MPEGFRICEATLWLFLKVDGLDKAIRDPERARAKQAGDRIEHHSGLYDVNRSLACAHTLEHSPPSTRFGRGVGR